MRITAPETQIAAIIEANQILRNQTQQLGAMALQLDRSEIRPDAARTLCGLACTEASDAQVKAASGYSRCYGEWPMRRID